MSKFFAKQMVKSPPTELKGITMNFIYSKESNRPVNDVELSLQKAITNHNFGILGIIDLQSKMQEKNVQFDRACKIYEICNPHLARQVLEKEMNISTVLPCRISIYEEGSKTRVATALPTETLKLFGEPSITDIAEKVEKDIKEMVDDAISEN